MTKSQRQRDICAVCKGRFTLALLFRYLYHDLYFTLLR